jgi:ATP-dependent RNA helicase RhlE
LTNSFASLGIAEPILRALTAEKYETPTPIQAQAIPALLAGKDLLGVAQTGTGKTAAFAIPILQQLSANRAHPVPKSPRALILAPTRELAIQIETAFRTYGRNLGLRAAVVVGGVGYGDQIKALHRGVDILVATPGRLMDHMQSGHVRLDRVTHLVLDEADRMLDMGFVRDVRKIVAALPKRRHSMFFSATMPPDVSKLASEMLFQPVRVEVTPQVITVDKITQNVHFVHSGDKRTHLIKLLDDAALARVIVFTRTKHAANRVAETLERAKIPSEAIHGNKSQNARQRALERFRSGRARVLVATDIAARGIDVDGITHVVNYELPNVPETYVHRIGRTARAGAEGVAISLCDGSERTYLRDIERLTKRAITVVGGQPAPQKERSQGERSQGPRPKQAQSNRNGQAKHWQRRRFDRHAA